MKKIVCLFILKVCVCCLHAQLLTAPTPTWKVTLKVVDNAGRPIPNASAAVYYLMTKHITGLTGTNGIFIASHQDKSYDLAFEVNKPGYYSYSQRYQLGWPYQYDQQPERWNPSVEVLLRKKINPIALYAKREEATLQQEGNPMGFDLMVGDWVSPYGKGRHSDILFTVNRKIINQDEYDCTLTVSFQNKGDGIAIAPSEPNTGSEFKTSRTAANEGYDPELFLHYRNTSQPASVFGYFIRVQTVLDVNGNVKSALYGKISGNFRFYPGTVAPHAGLGFTYYLNPTANDRNLEFDLNQNLIKNLGVLEQVKEP